MKYPKSQTYLVKIYLTVWVSFIHILLHTALTIIIVINIDRSSNICRAKDRKHFVYFSQKLTAARNGVALSYHRVRGLYFLAVVFVATIVLSKICARTRSTH